MKTLPESTVADAETYGKFVASCYLKQPRTVWWGSRQP